MYAYAPPAVFIHRDAWTEPRSRARAEAILRGLAEPREPVFFGDEDLPAMVRDGLLAARKPMGTLAEVRDPVLLLNTFRFDGRAEERRQVLAAAGVDIGGAAAVLAGDGAFRWANYNLPGDPDRTDKVCRPCWRIHLHNGCIHRCAYCGLGGLLVVPLNIEEYCTHLGELIARHPWQQTYLLDDDADPPCLEPEAGILSDLIEYFGTLRDRYLIIHTKTHSADWLKGLRHNGNTILVWSISGPTQSRVLEPRAGTTRERIRAARIAADAGYTIRYKFKPIIPVRDWGEDADETARLIFEQTRPDVISLCCFMWMDVEEMVRRLGEETLDPEFLAAARASRDEMKGTRTRPFPPAVRAAIYDRHLGAIRRWDADIPVSLSTENFAMWAEYGAKLGYTATNYPCGCGPMTVPGAPKLSCHPYASAVRNDRGEVPGVLPPWVAS